MPGFARVAINIAKVDELFDYSIPEELKQWVTIGSLVVVPFGNQTVQGSVIRLLGEPSVLNVRPITALLDEQPVFSSAQMDLAAWMAESNLSTLSECLDQMLPPGLGQHADSLYHLNLQDRPEPDPTPMQKRVLTALTRRGDLRGRQLDVLFPRVDWRSSMQSLVRQGMVVSRPVLGAPTVHARTVRSVQLTQPADKALSVLENTPRVQAAARSRRRSILLLLQKETGPVDVTYVYAEAGGNAADIKSLAELGLIAVGETEFWRDPLAGLSAAAEQIPTLNTAQAAAWQAIEQQITGKIRKKPNLLVGVTGSGKTELYLRAVQATLAQNRQAIILVPEISLTPQTVRRFMARFPGKVGLVHSRLSAGERYDTWRRVRLGQLPVVVGARSALFAPLPDLGLIVIDECHEESYFQDDLTPHYSAVETALTYARKTDAVLILGSATPTIEQVYRAKKEGWYELTLPERILAHEATSESPTRTTPEPPGVLALPEVQIVDMREELKAGNRAVLSNALHQALDEVLKQQEQAILFLNRRGSASYIFCRDCGYVLRCPRCSTQMTFHETGNVLLCHRCNYRRKMPVECPNCKSRNIRQFGLGTEGLEKTVHELFPSARILRWDADTARYKGAHDLIMDHFSQHRADILIGTKMLAKGLDLPLVTLVGVVLADVSLNLPDFRAPERTFQLLCQVAGRAGRSRHGGKVVFQTFSPDNYAIRTAAHHDLEGFYQKEIELRRKTGYPPFSRLLRLEFHHHDEKITQLAAEKVGEKLSAWIGQTTAFALEMIGPVPCFYAKFAGQYRWQILLKGNDPRSFLLAHPLNTWRPREVNIDITVDPPDLL